MLTTIILERAELEALLEQAAERGAQLAMAKFKPPAPVVDDGKRLYKEREAAKELNISVSSLQRWRLQGYIVPTSQTKPIRYSKKDLAAVVKFMERGGVHCQSL